MNPHTPYILAAYSLSTIILLVTAILPLFRGHKLRQQLTRLIQADNPQPENMDNS